MTLHISFNCKDDELKHDVINYLLEFYRKKRYTVNDIKTYDKKNDKYILNISNYAFLLNKAYDREIIFRNKDFTKCRLVFWDSSFIDDYLHQNEFSLNYVKTLNKEFKQFDLYITIDDEVNLKTNKLNHHIIKNDEHLLENIVKTIFNTLPRCNWCGKLFKPSKEHKTYCTSKCAEYSLQDQNRENNRNFYKRYREVLSEKQKGGLGSKNANLKANSPNLKSDEPDFLKELQTIRNAKKKMGL